MFFSYNLYFIDILALEKLESLTGQCLMAVVYLPFFTESLLKDVKLVNVKIALRCQNEANMEIIFSYKHTWQGRGFSYCIRKITSGKIT